MFGLWGIKSDKVAILNYGNFERENYGAILTAYALSKLLRMNGYDVKNINYRPNFYQPFAKNDTFVHFRRKFLPMTKTIKTQRDFKKLNKKYSVFVVGSDQVFNHDFVRKENDVYYLGFVDDNRRKVACAASFGTNRFMGDDAEKQHVHDLLARFDAISVREPSGVDILHDMGLDGVYILDPVFLIDWDDMIGNYHPNGTFYYSIWPQIQNIAADKNTFASGMSAQDWLAGIKNADLLVTDSFHGICFAIMFGTPFVPLALKTDARIERLYALFDAVGISRDQILYSDSDTDWENLQQYAITPNVGDNLDKLRRFSVQWILDALKG